MSVHTCSDLPKPIDLADRKHAAWWFCRCCSEKCNMRPCDKNKTFRLVSGMNIMECVGNKLGFKTRNSRVLVGFGSFLQICTSCLRRTEHFERKCLGKHFWLIQTTSLALYQSVSLVVVVGTLPPNGCEVFCYDHCLKSLFRSSCN